MADRFFAYNRHKLISNSDFGIAAVLSSGERFLRPQRCAMLVLSRKKNESLVIRDDIVIVVVEIRGDKVRLGIEAPKDVPVHRREVYEAIKKAEQQKPV